MNITFVPEIKKTPKANGEYPLFIRITVNRVIKRISLGYTIPLRDWNSKKKEVKKSNPNFRKINDAIEDAISEYKQKQKAAKVYSAGAVRAVLKNKKVSNSFFQFANDLAETKNFNNSRGLKSEIEKFRNFVDNKDLVFEEITKNLLSKYQKHLKDVEKNKETTIGKALKKLKSIFNQAVIEDVISVQNNPMYGWKIKHGKPKSKFVLNEASLIELEGLKLEEGSLIWNIRNYYLFAYYVAGMRFSDVCNLKWENIVTDDKGDTRVDYVSVKTQYEHSTLLVKKAETILEAYKTNSTEPKAFVFPILDVSQDLNIESTFKKEISRKNALANKYLAILSKMLELNGNISFHSSRNLFAHQAIKSKDMHATSMLMGHSSEEITKKYLKEKNTEIMDSVMRTTFQKT
jgi:integrase